MADDTPTPINYLNEDGTPFEGEVTDDMTVVRHFRADDGRVLEYVVLQPRQLARPVD